MSLANVQGKLSRIEMSKIMAGSGTCGSCMKGGTEYGCYDDGKGHCANSYCGTLNCTTSM